MSTGFEKIRTKVGGTGVIADLVPSPGAGMLMLRADMDALPIREITCFDYASGKYGMMHACGHDAHSAMFLARGKVPDVEQ
jgi:metal-dependent amidase/aminoacylase/carboxypeptidase family protein